MIKKFKSFGVLESHKMEVEAEGQIYKYLSFQDANGVEWQDLAAQSEPFDFYIAITDEGRIVSMESDPDASQIAGLEIIGINVSEDFNFTNGPGGTVYGKVWDGGKIVDPTPEVLLPPLTARQLRLGLASNGISLSQVESTIDAIENQQDRDIARIEWEYASTFDRNHHLIEQVGGALGLTAEQIDTMWLEASNL